MAMAVRKQEPHPALPDDLDIEDTEIFKLFNFIEKLGEGAYGKVYKANHRSGLYAIKKFEFNTMRMACQARPYGRSHC